MVLLVISFITVTVGSADAATGYDCYIKRYNMTTVSFAGVIHETEILTIRSFGTAHPDEYAYQFMGGPGYITLMEEDKFHIMQCEPVTVILEPQDKCYNRIPILRGAQELFLTPWTHIITKSAKAISCDAPSLQHYKLEAITYKVFPRPVYSLESNRLKPKTALTWTYYKESVGLANGGIYPENDVQNILDRMYHPGQFHPPLVYHQEFPDADGNTPGVIYLNREPHHLKRYQHLNTYSIIAIVAVVLLGIFVCGCIGNHGSALYSVNRAYNRSVETDKAEKQMKAIRLKVRLHEPLDV